MLDLADVLADPKADELAAAKARVKKMAAAVATVAPGCGRGAAGFMFAPVTAFVIPAVLAGVALFASTAGAERTSARYVRGLRLITSHLNKRRLFDGHQ